MQGSLIPRLRLADFIGTFPAGLYVLWCLYHMQGRWLFDQVQTGQSAAMDVTIAVLVSYVVGAAFRSLPVRYIDIACWKGNPFPYVDTLSRSKAWLPERIRSQIEIPTTKEARMAQFDQWKNRLCHGAPNLFEHVHSLEARVRFLAAFVWATSIGTVLGAIGTVLGAIGLRAGGDVRAAGSVVIVSCISCGLCLYSVGRARKEEISEVVWAYAAFLEAGDKS